MKKIISLTTLIALLFIVACSKITDDSGNLFGNYDQTTMLTNVGNSLMTNINSTSTNASNISTAITAFTTNPTDETLTAAQNAFNTLAQTWALAAPFNFGPMSDNFISTYIDTWPSDTTKINTAVANQSTAISVGANVKGLKALEFLLFNKNGNAVVLAKYTNATDAANRKTFINSVAQDLVTQTTNLQNAWNNGYLTSFNTAKGNDVSSSVSQLVNGIAIYLDNIKNLKIGNPIGMGVKVNDGAIHANLIEYTIDEQSLPVMIANLQAMKAAFDGSSQQGLDDLLDYVKAKSNGQNLSTVVDAQFDDAIAKLNAINSPYATALSTQTQQVQDVFNSLKQLIAYFKVDVANNLGVTITFTDTDGD